MYNQQCEKQRERAKVQLVRVHQTSAIYLIFFLTFIFIDLLLTLINS